MDVDKLVRYDAKCPEVCEDNCSTCLIQKLNDLEADRMPEKVVDLQKRREGKRVVYIAGTRSKVYHNFPLCPKLEGARNTFAVSLAELKEVEPNVKECKHCGM